MSPNIIEIERALDRDDLPGAAALAIQALANGLREPLVFNLVAWRHEEDDRLDEAEAVIRQSLDLWPGDPSLHLALGVVLRKVGRMREAVQAFERAIELDPSYAAAWFERGATFERGGALADAAQDFRHVIALEPGNISAHAALSASLARRGQREEATQHAHVALRGDPGNVAAHNALALVAIEEKRFADAVSLLEPVVANAANTHEMMVSTRTLLGDAYEGAGRYDEAYEAYRGAQELFHTVNSARLGEGHRDALESAARIAMRWKQRSRSVARRRPPPRPGADARLPHGLSPFGQHAGREYPGDFARRARDRGAADARHDRS